MRNLPVSRRRGHSIGSGQRPLIYVYGCGSARGRCAAPEANISQPKASAGSRRADARWLASAFGPFRAIWKLVMHTPGPGGASCGAPQHKMFRWNVSTHAKAFAGIPDKHPGGVAQASRGAAKEFHLEMTRTKISAMARNPLFAPAGALETWRTKRSPLLTVRLCRPDRDRFLLTRLLYYARFV